MLRSFTNAVLHCSTTADVTNLLNTAVDRTRREEQGEPPQDAAVLKDDDLRLAASAIIRVYGELLVKVSEVDQDKYPACLYPESLLPIPKPALAKLVAVEIERTSDASERRVLETGLALLDGFIDDEQANEQNAVLREAFGQSRPGDA